MKKLLFLLLILLTLSAVSAGNNTTDIPNPTHHIENTSIVIALESGDSNISFSDGYKGYCIEWGEHSATAGEKFYLNNEVDNNIKTFFVYFYDEAQKDVISTQHMIWKFTDNKQFSRFNQTLYEQIIAKSSTTQVPNEGSIPFGENQKMVFSFKNFISEFEEYQNYFGYKIFFTNNTCDLNESTTNNSNISYEQLQNITSQITFNGTYIIDNNDGCCTCTSDNEKIEVAPVLHETGTNIDWLIGCLVIMIIICILLY